jgi:GDPmannose 4,6-dehydratase
MGGKRALITGITGQDGSYLAELLLEKGYQVHGMVRRVALEDPEHRLSRLLPALGQLDLHAASLESYASIHTLIEKVQPEECYHLAAQSFVSYSFDDEFSTLNANINGTHFLLAALRNLAPQCRFYFAGSSEMFGRAHEVPQTEATPFHPRSSYGISKVAGFHLTRNYREAYGLHASNGILFNHESPRRGYEFVTRKIAAGVARVLAGRAHEVRLGNLDARAGLGKRAGVRPGDVADAAAAGARRLRGGDRRDALGAGVRRSGLRLRRPGLPQAHAGGPEPVPAGRGQHPVGGCEQGAEGAGMAAHDRIPGAGARDGGKRVPAAGRGGHGAERRPELIARGVP